MLIQKIPVELGRIICKNRHIINNRIPFATLVAAQHAGLDDSRKIAGCDPQCMGSGEVGVSWCWESAVKTGPEIAFGTSKMIAVSTSDSVVYSGDPTRLHRRIRVRWTEAGYGCDGQ